jgi:LysR family nod box-dependent transcriptional activator
MEFRNFDVGLLVALDALLSEKSVTRAGERLHLSQPATSIILGRLRQYFGNRLLVPSGRRMVLTPLAESLVQPVRSCLIQIQHTVASKTEFNPAASNRKFCLAASDPKETLFEDTHTCVVWRKNSLIGNKISRNQFLKAGHIEVHFGQAPAIFEGWFAAHYGQMRNIEVLAQDFEVACRLVAGTNRIATVMSRMALLCADYLPIRLLRPPFAITKVIHCLQWHRYQDQDPGHIWIRAILKKAAGELGPAPMTGTSVSIGIA